MKQLTIAAALSATLFAGGVAAKDLHDFVNQQGDVPAGENIEAVVSLAKAEICVDLANHHGVEVSDIWVEHLRTGIDELKFIESYDKATVASWQMRWYLEDNGLDDTWFKANCV